MNELQPLSVIFQNKIFRIPDYQRGYAWQEPQLRDFWDDIVNLQKDRYHYTGLLSMKVLDKEESRKLDNDDQWLLQSGFKAYHIVDGQQRLTTFMIMLNEIIELICTLPENSEKPEEQIYLGFENVRDIKAKYICRKRPPDGIITTYMFGYENDNPSAEYLKHRIFGQPFGGTIRETYYTKNLQYAKLFFSTELKAFYEAHGIDAIAELYKTLTLHLMFNIHEIEDDYDVFVAFETMNNRGKRLTNLELLKNRLIYLTTLYSEEILDKTNGIALRELINKAWREVYYQLGRNEEALLSDDEFLRAHWIMYFAYSRKKGDDYIKFLLRKFSHKSIYGSTTQLTTEPVEVAIISDPEVDDDDDSFVESEEPISGEFLQPKEIMDYVNSLNEAAEYWYYTYYPTQCSTISDEEQVWLEKLNHIGVGYFRPLIAVSLIPRLGIEQEKRIEFFKAVERFIFINFRMAMYQSSYKSSDYYRKTREVYTENLTLDEVITDLNNTTDSNATDAVKVFLTRMNRRFISADGFYSWRDLRYFLYEYEYSLVVKHKIEKLSWALLTKVVKDKISVEHILPQTPTKLYWRNYFRQFSEAEIKCLSASLGNMLPLSQSINSSLQNDSFDDKKARGYANGCHCEVEISKEPLWDAQHIYDRGIKLLRFMETRWGFKFESDEQMDELLHIGFVKDGREIPPEISEVNVVATTLPKGKDKSERPKSIAALIHSWASIKDASGEIHVHEEKCTRKYCRFTTDALSAVLTDTSDANSGWGTKNHYFFEIINDAGKQIYMQLAFSSRNMPSEQKKQCEEISMRLPTKKHKSNWQWWCPFITKHEDITDTMNDEEIIEILNAQYSLLKEFEKRLIDELSTN